MTRAPASAAHPTVNLHTIGKPADVVVQGNYRLTAEGSDNDVRHIILDLGNQPFPVLEGQSVGVIAPGTDAAGRPYLPRLYSVSSPRDGERPNFNNLSLTVKREPGGVCSNHLCDLNRGDRLRLTGPFGATFLLPADPAAHLMMICTGTGSAPFRAFTMHRQRENPALKGRLTLIFGARAPEDLPYFGPLKKVPDSFLTKIFAFSRQPDQPKRHVQDQLRADADAVAALLHNPDGHVYICGLKAMEHGVEAALSDIAPPPASTGPWRATGCASKAVIMWKPADMTAAPFEHEIRVTWGDCDPARIAYTARLPWFALDAINAWWEHHLGGDGWFQMEMDRNIGTPFVHMSMDFCAPVTPRHRLRCRVWANRLGQTSVGFRVEGHQNGQLCFAGDFVSVFVRADRFARIPPPEAIRAVVLAHLCAGPQNNAATSGSLIEIN